MRPTQLRRLQTTDDPFTRLVVFGASLIDEQWNQVLEVPCRLWQCPIPQPSTVLSTSSAFCHPKGVSIFYYLISITGIFYTTSGDKLIVKVYPL